MKNLGNISHAVTIDGVYIVVTNYNISITLVLESLDLICVASDNTDVAAYFEKVYQSVRFVNTKSDKFSEGTSSI